MLGLGVVHRCYEGLDYLIGFVCQLPVFSTNYWQTDLTLFINVGANDLCVKCGLQWFEWVVCWKVDFNSEGPLILWRVVRNDKPLPSQ